MSIAEQVAEQRAYVERHFPNNDAGTMQSGVSIGDVEGLLEDALRCPWISMQGSSGVDPHTGERNGNNVHCGAEFWPHPPSPDFVEHYRKGTAWGIACLTAPADAILEHEAATIPGIEQP